MAQTAWFLGPTLQDPRQVEFMAALTRAAEAGKLADVDAAQTLSVAADDGSSVDVGLVVPGLTCDRKFLAVTYERRSWPAVADISLDGRNNAED